MNQAVHNKNVSFIWSIADDCLRDIYVRGKYRDVILPMVVLRRLDSLLEPTKEKVLEEVAFQKDDMGLVELDEKGLQDAAGYVFYNISKWTLKSLFATATNNQQILQANVEDYLAGFSANVKEINDETYAICKSDMMIKGNDPKNIRPGSTLSTDEFASSRFDFMLSNPPYGIGEAKAVV